MVGRGVYGRPWIAGRARRALATGGEIEEPDVETRLGVVLDHLRESLVFYGERAGAAGVPQAPRLVRRARALAGLRASAPRRQGRAVPAG